jgi:thiol:disulfide interchange protein DsbA
MLKKIAFANLFLVFFLAFSGLCFAEENSKGYEALKAPQPTQHADKVEVIEFFWYGCPHCYQFEPTLARWLKTKPANVEFIRQPAAFNELRGKHAKAYFVAEALGVGDKVHDDFFDEIQNKQNKLDTEEALGKFFVAHGVTEAQFKDAFNSFAVDAKTRQASVISARYGLTGVPAIVINGKYLVNATLGGTHEKMLDAMNTLIAQESVKK